MGADCGDISKPKTDTTCPSGITIQDVQGPDGPLYVAAQVTGHPVWGTIPPIIKKRIQKEAVKRENEDHGATGDALPTPGTTLPEVRRAAEGEEAKVRADRSRLGNQRDLEPTSLDIFRATAAAWGAPIAVGSAGRLIDYAPQRWNNPQIKALQPEFKALNDEIEQERKDFAKTKKGTPDYVRLKERLAAYDRLKLGQAKTQNGQTIADAEMGEITSGTRTSFTAAEVQQLDHLRTQEKLLLAEKGRAWETLTGDQLGGVLRLGRGITGAFATYVAGSIASSDLKRSGYDELAEFAAPSTLEVAAIGGTMTAPVPKFVPFSSSGRLGARLGSRAIWEVGVDLASKIVSYGVDKFTDPDVVRRHLDEAKKAQADDHDKKTPDTMNAAIDAWKTLTNHDNQIQQALNDTLTHIGTTDPATLAQTRRDLVALYTAFGESRLADGTHVGGLGPDGERLLGLDGKRLPEIKIHNLFAGEQFDFGGVALTNLNTARNLLNELGIPITDPVAKRVYGSLSQSDTQKIFNGHDNFPKLFDQLRTMVRGDDPDAKWLSLWLDTRVSDQKKLLALEEKASLAAKELGHKFVPQYNNFVMAKIYQDQAMLELAYAAEGQDPQTHLKAAHDDLQEAKRIGWDGREIKVKGETLKRESDLPKIIDIYVGLGGKVDWDSP